MNKQTGFGQTFLFWFFIAAIAGAAVWFITGPEWRIEWIKNKTFALTNGDCDIRANDVRWVWANNQWELWWATNIDHANL